MRWGMLAWVLTSGSPSAVLRLDHRSIGTELPNMSMRRYASSPAEKLPGRRRSIVSMAMPSVAPAFAYATVLKPTVWLSAAPLCAWLRRAFWCGPELDPIPSCCWLMWMWKRLRASPCCSPTHRRREARLSGRPSAHSLCQ